MEFARFAGPDDLRRKRGGTLRLPHVNAVLRADGFVDRAVKAQLNG
jgi:hypothetical protein